MISRARFRMVHLNSSSVFSSSCCRVLKQAGGHSYKFDYMALFVVWMISPNCLETRALFFGKSRTTHALGAGGRAFESPRPDQRK